LKKKLILKNLNSFVLKKWAKNDLKKDLRIFLVVLMIIFLLIIADEQELVDINEDFEGFIWNGNHYYKKSD
jgi:hypothetical protein